MGWSCHARELTPSRGLRRRYHASGAETHAPLLAAAAQDLATAVSGHARTEAQLALPHPIRGLECAFHRVVPSSDYAAEKGSGRALSDGRSRPWRQGAGGARRPGPTSLPARKDAPVTIAPCRANASRRLEKPRGGAMVGGAGGRRGARRCRTPLRRRGSRTPAGNGRPIPTLLLYGSGLKDATGHAHLQRGPPLG